MAQIVDQPDNVGRVLNGTIGETNTLIGRGGNDTLNGAALQDLIYGGTGNDIIRGGLGADRVVFQHDFTNALNFGTDRWLDFKPGESDKIDVSALGQGEGSGGALGIGEMDTVRAIWSNFPVSGGGDVLLSWGSSKLRLAGVQTADLGSASFVFNTVNVADVLVLGAGHQIVALSYGNDFVDSGGGNDTLFGEQGNDTVLGGDGADSLFGGSGNDVIWGDGGIDTLFGGAGADTLVSGGGMDLFYGGTGADRVQMQHGALRGTDNSGGRWVDFSQAQGDRIVVARLGGSDSSLYDIGVGELDSIKALDAPLAGGGVSVVWGGSRLDLPGITTLTAAMFQFSTSTKADNIALNGTSNLIAVAGGDDTVAGNGGNDTIFGEQGRDELYGGNGLDQLYGGTGQDKLSGGAGNDTLYGGADGDTLDGGAGADLMVGGAGDDLYLVDQAPYPLDPFDGYDRIVELAGGGTDLVRVSVLEYTLGANLENAEVTTTVGGAYMGFGLPVMLTGNGLNNQLTGSSTTGGVQQIISGAAGNDVINGLGGIDYLFGDTGNDTVDGGSGNDMVFGGRGSDLISGGTGRDILNGDDVAGIVNGGLARQSSPTEDRFLFDVAAGAANADKIGDFDSLDFIVLDRSVFTSLTGTSGRAIAARNFVQGANALDADDFILYDSATGALWYDADGNGAGAKQLIANIYSGTTYTVERVTPNFAEPYGLRITPVDQAASGINNLDILLL